MWKIFLRVWILVFLPLVYLLFSETYNPIAAINRLVLHDRIEQTYAGTFYLLEKELQKAPISDWPEAFAPIAEHFGHEIRLISGTTEIEGQQALTELTQGEFLIFSDEFGSDVIVRRVVDSDWFIYMLLDASEDQQTLAEAQGTLNLWLAYFEDAPPEQWPMLVKELSANFTFALNLVEKPDLALPKAKLAQLEKLGRTWMTNEDTMTLVFLSLPDSELTLVGGPIPLPGDQLAVLVVIVSIFVGGISLGIFVFVFPLWKDLKNLAKTAESFGKGYLQERSSVKGRSVIGELSNSFNTMADQIEKMVEGQRELTNSIAHDLRTPLSRVSFAFEMLEDDDTITKKERARYKRSIASGIDTLDHLIQQILTLSRYNRAADISQFSRCELWRALSEEIDMIRIEHEDIEIDLQMPSELLAASEIVDQRSLLRAFNNLVSNALRYCEGRIRVTLKRQNNLNHLIVEDNGRGIPESEYESVFIPFKQLDNPQRENSVHHGLGLAIVKQVATLHNGEVIVAQSDLGGAKFELKWPGERR